MILTARGTFLDTAKSLWTFFGHGFFDIQETLNIYLSCQKNKMI